MEALAGPYAAAAALLVAGGLPKTWSPGSTATALRGLRLPSGRALVRLLGAAEAATGVAALARPTALTAAALAVWYAAFTAVVALALRADRPLETCGCFAEPDTPPTVPHLVLVAAAGAVAAAVAARPVGAVLDRGVPFLALAGCVAWFGYLVMTRLAMLR